MLSALCASASEYYVATNGNDSWAGTLGSPYRTIQKAADVMTAGDTCYIRAGEYPEQVTPANSGTPVSPIVFRPYSNEVVTISGADPVTGWTLDSGSIYRATVGWNLGKNNQVFFNGTNINEARWPNDADGDVMTPDGAAIGVGSSEQFIYCASFPGGATATSWNGGVIWVLAGSMWSSWTAMVTNYSVAAKRVYFVPAGNSWVNDYMNPSAGGEFHITGIRYALDMANEWYWDTNSATLYLWTPGGVNPSTHLVTAKKRFFAFDLSRRTGIHLLDLNVRAATLGLSDVTNCIVQGMELKDFYHSRGGNSIDDLPGESPGIYISGRNNVIRDCLIEGGVADGIVVSGWSNAVINCLVRNIDYFGCYGTPVKLRGMRHLISHNTIERCGRDGLQYYGAEHVVQYNDISEMGLICNDLGATYQGGNDGGNMQVHHNWAHDNYAAPHSSGLYLDNFSHNYIFYQNVVWSCGGAHLQFNTPGDYNFAYNNTLIGSVDSYNPTIATARGGILANNIATAYNVGTGAILTSNNTDLGGLTAGNATTYIPANAVDNGLLLPGINSSYAGNGPNRGAYETLSNRWVAGHNFTNPPSPVFVLPFIPYQTQLRDACFEYSKHDACFTIGQPDACWVRTDAGQATVTNSPGFNTHPDTRNCMFGNSVTLQGATDDGIQQNVTGLLPGTLYRVRGWMRRGTAGSIRLGARSYGGNDTYATVASTSWTDSTLTFRTGPTNTAVIIYIRKIGSGTAYADDLGVSMEFQPAVATVDAGPNRTAAGASTVVTGALNLCGAALTSVEWSVVSGPGMPDFNPPDSLATLVSFPTNGEYVLRLDVATELQGCSDTVRVTVVESLPLPPFYSTGLVLWLDAADPNGDRSLPAGGTAMSTWADKSGGGYNATQSGGLRPTFQTNVLQGLPVIRFDGIDDSIITPSIRAGAGAMHCFVVSASAIASGDTWQRLVSAWDGVASDDYQPTGWTMLRPQSSGAPVTYLATVFSDSYASGRSIPAIMLGDNAKGVAQHLRGDIGEVLVYDHELTGADLASVTNYLYWKWIASPPPSVDLRGLSFSSTNLELIATGTNNWTPRVWFTTNLMMPDWQPAPNQSWQYSGGQYTLTVEPGSNQCEYYRVSATNGP